jgi:scyllo-inositol 2-dehydrogenase (NADP+)
MKRNQMIKAALIGVGKMGLSHYAILGADPRVEIAAICDSNSFLSSTIRKYTGVRTFKDYEKMFDSVELDCVVIATPTSTHFPTVRTALKKGIHVFAEKPLCLNPTESKELMELANASGLINQVGYHNRFLGTFREARRLINTGALGDVYHINGSAFGQVILRPKSGGTWRSSKAEGGGCLHDYASHVVDLMNFLVGPPEQVLGAQLTSIYSRDVEDAVYATFRYANGGSGQLETNWSDETYRKMSTTIVAYGTKGKIIADRQDLKVFMRQGSEIEPYAAGWTIRYITDLQEAVGFYLRGEEYSSQLAAFVSAVEGGSDASENSFASAYETDRVIDMIMRTSKR